jgi:hypothetical protein
MLALRCQLAIIQYCAKQDMEAPAVKREAEEEWGKNDDDQQEKAE